MSYILDALNKAEKERHLGDVPTIDSNHDTAREEKPGRMMPVLIIAALLLNFGLIAYLFVDTSENANATQLPQANTGTINKKPMAHKERPPMSIDKRKHAEPSINQQPSPLEEINQKVARLEALVEKNRSESVQNAVLASPVSVSSEPQSNDADGIAGNGITKPMFDESPQDPEQVPYLTEKPAGFQESIPDLNIDVHVYSEIPSKRFILINLKKYQEDQHIAKGLMLEEITEEGMILSYQQEKFRWPVMAK